MQFALWSCVELLDGRSAGCLAQHNSSLMRTLWWWPRIAHCMNQLCCTAQTALMTTSPLWGTPVLALLCLRCTDAEDFVPFKDYDEAVNAKY